MSLGEVTRAKDTIQQKRVSHRPWPLLETVLLVGLTQGSVMKHGASYTTAASEPSLQLSFTVGAGGERLPSLLPWWGTEGSHHSGPLG